uniref:Uncharacterized protein n=1 Tax=Anguilla anguilla TaxID=7936 RepID=A0A0E9UYR3_ANGAN
MSVIDVTKIKCLIAIIITIDYY